MSDEIYTSAGLVKHMGDWWFEDWLLDGKIVIYGMGDSCPSPVLDQRIGIGKILHACEKERAIIAALGFVIFDEIEYGSYDISIDYHSLLRKGLRCTINIDDDNVRDIYIVDDSEKDPEFRRGDMLSVDEFKVNCPGYMKLIEVNRAAAGAIKFLLPQPIAEEILAEFAV